jgi:Outer membrane protein beta-barrel domain
VRTWTSWPARYAGSSGKTRSIRRIGVVAIALLLFSAAAVSAEWQIKPFVGLKFGGSTTFEDFDNPENPGGSRNIAFGAAGGFLGEVVGVEGDFAHVPGFFAGPEKRLLGSSATTLTGNVVIAVPRHLTQYTLRPYFVGGVGLLHSSIEPASLPSIVRTLTALDFGGGATGFLTNRVGVNFDVRYFRTVAGENRGFSLGQPEEVSFWRASIGLVFRY